MRGKTGTVLDIVFYSLVVGAVLSAILLCIFTVNEIGYMDGYCTAIGGESLGTDNKSCNVDGRIVKVK